jgi:hypothetical protein
MALDDPAGFPLVGETLDVARGSEEEPAVEERAHGGQGDEAVTVFGAQPRDLSPEGITGPRLLAALVPGDRVEADRGRDWDAVNGFAAGRAQKALAVGHGRVSCGGRDSNGVRARVRAVPGTA